MCSEVGMDPQSLSYRFLNEIMDHHVHIGVPEEIGSNVPNLIKDVPNLMKDVLRGGDGSPITFLWVSK